MLGKPQIPTPQQLQRPQNWGAMGENFTQVTKYLQDHVRYLQQYLAQVYGAVVLATPTFVAAATSPYKLPSATGSQAQFIVKNLTGGSLTVNPTGSDTIDGSSSYVMSVPLQSTTFVDYGAGTWAII